MQYCEKLKEGLGLSDKFYYQYLNFLFRNINCSTKPVYKFEYSIYPGPLEEFVGKHNKYWEKVFKENNELINL